MGSHLDALHAAKSYALATSLCQGRGRSRGIKYRFLSFKSFQAENRITGTRRRCGQRFGLRSLSNSWRNAIHDHKPLSCDTWFYCTVVNISHDRQTRPTAPKTSTWLNKSRVGLLQKHVWNTVYQHVISVGFVLVSKPAELSAKVNALKWPKP